MSDVPPPNFSETNSPKLRHVLALFGRGAIYAVAFWLVYFGLYRIYPGGTPTDSDEKLRQRQIAQMNTYDEQAKKSEEMFVESEHQQARINAWLTKQEELAKRFDVVIDHWEKQAGIHK